MEDDQTDPEMVLLVLMERAFKGPTHEGVRILDWAPQLKRVLKCVRENDPMTMELRGEIERLRAENEALKANSVHLYNLGYHAGHNDTVEACYMHIVAADMETYHSDVVAEIMAALAAKGA